MDDESSLIKLKLYLFSSADNDQQQEQWQLTVEEKKDCWLTGQPTCASGLKIRRNPYGGNIKPAKFSKSLGKYKQFLERQNEK